MMNILYRKHRLVSCWSLLIQFGLPLTVECERAKDAFEPPLDDLRYKCL